uniref:Uncharacterized protein n=1 Tax=Macaca nemestrina TaxID=9545 RepID=A0A2K6D7H1_MACNE
ISSAAHTGPVNSCILSLLHCLPLSSPAWAGRQSEGSFLCHLQAQEGSSPLPLPILHPNYCHSRPLHWTVSSRWQALCLIDFCISRAQLSLIQRKYL